MIAAFKLLDCFILQGSVIMFGSPGFQQTVWLPQTQSVWCQPIFLRETKMESASKMTKYQFLCKMISLFTSGDIQIQVEINVIQIKKDMNMKGPYWWHLNRLYLNGSVAKIIIIKLTTANCSESRNYSKLQNFNSSWTIIN